MADVCRRFIFVDSFRQFLIDRRASPTRFIDFFTALLPVSGGLREERKARVNENGLSTLRRIAKALLAKSENSLTLCCRRSTWGVSRRWLDGPPLTIQGCLRMEAASNRCEASLTRSFEIRSFASEEMVDQSSSGNSRVPFLMAEKSFCWQM